MHIELIKDTFENTLCQLITYLETVLHVLLNCYTSVLKLLLKCIHMLLKWIHMLLKCMHLVLKCMWCILKWFGPILKWLCDFFLIFCPKLAFKNKAHVNTSTFICSNYKGGDSRKTTERMIVIRPKITTNNLIKMWYSCCYKVTTF